MSLWSKARAGLRHAVAGDFAPILEFLVSYTEGRALSTPRVRQGPAATIPFDEPGLLFWDRGADHDVYYRFLDRQQVDWTPPEPVDDARFTIVDCHRVDRLTVDVEFTGPDGQTDDSTFRFTDGEFNDRFALPLRFTTPFPATEVSIDVRPESADNRATGAGERSATATWSKAAGETPRPSIPTGTPASDGTRHPVFLVSIDSLRYDHVDALEPLVDALGPNAVVPAEPRTQGIQTWQSHGSMFTGVHPARHGCCGPKPRLSPSLVTLAEYFEMHGYHSSGVAGGAGLLPEIGFGRGFDRYERKEMSWETRQFDARTNVDTVIDWVETDHRYGDTGGFYFLHLFDAHYPYLPPLPATDCEDLDYEAMSAFVDTDQPPRRLADLEREDPLTVDPRQLELAKTYYRDAVAYTARQVARLVDRLKSLGLFEDSFIVVTGDHGEEFAERNRLFHRTLHDTNIRPGMVVKPPTDSDLVVPDDPDLVDLLPTAAALLDEPAPDHCLGRPWVASREPRPRITETVGPEYHIAVESNGYKGVFQFDESDRQRPSTDAIEAGPTEAHFRVLDALREDPTSEAARAVPEAKQAELLSVAREFLRTTGEHGSGDGTEIPDDVRDRLEDLGYA